MIIRKISGGALLALIAHAVPTHAYELATHARLTYNALLQSVTHADPEFPYRLGLSGGWHTDLGSAYIDSRFGIPSLRSAWRFDFDQDKMPRRDISGYAVDEYRTTPQGWLMAGAVREDDSGRGAQWGNQVVFNAEQEPLDDPWGNFNRYCNHFFDPLYNRPLTASCFSDTFATAPIWALGVYGPFAAPLTTAADPARRNHFTVADAREALWRGLTGMTQAGAVVAPDEATRKTEYATLFRALGDVLHLNQDMAQPQHTRDEAHGLGHAAWYEKYIDGRAKGLRTVTYDFRFGSLTANDLQPLTYAGYPAPGFERYSDYWSTGTGSATQDGKGLADYSSRGFFTPGKNFGNTEYPLPASDPAAYAEVAIADSAGIREYYFDATVRDAARNSSSRPIHMTRASLLDDALVAAAIVAGGTPGTAAAYTLDRATFDDRAELLIPRAVGYSAGILDYFFRGSIAISAPAEGLYAIADHGLTAVNAKVGGGFSKLKARVRNTTSAITAPGATSAGRQDMGGTGVLVAVVRFRRNDCYTPDLKGEYWRPMATDGFARAPDNCHSAPCPATAITGPNMVANYYIEGPDERLPVTNCSTTGPSIQSSEEYAVTSDMVLAALQINSGDPDGGQEVEFSFPSPIPINARDVYLHVVYRGPLGAEANGIAIGFRQLSAPSYFAIANMTDYVMCINGTFYRNNADGSLSDQQRSAILALGGSVADFTDPGLLPQAHDKVVLATQGPYPWPPISDLDPITVDPALKIAAASNRLAPGQYVRLAFLSDRNSGESNLTGNSFEAAVADAFAGDNRHWYFWWLTRVRYNVNVRRDGDNIATAVVKFRDFRATNIAVSYKTYFTTTNCVNTSLESIAQDNPPPSALVPFGLVSF
ncbi:MAG: hypothetical protein ACMG6H_02345 [Acidobacteriota bacterium]